jgi:site-specific recombinase XerD
MLTIYRRHKKSCGHREEGRKYRGCRCPIWVDGTLGREDIRKALGELNWERASKWLLEQEAAGEVQAEKPEEITIEQARQDFIADAEARKLKKSTIDRYRIIFRQLEAFAKKEGLGLLKELDTPVLSRFRATWKGSSGLADLKKLERVRSFFNFALVNGHIEKNPATALRNPRVRQSPTLPFSSDELIAILAAGAKKITEARTDRSAHARRLRALVLLLRYSGLRISDAVGCSADRIQNGKLFLYTQKTGQHVYCPLPEFVVDELGRLPRVSERYWFWSGNGTVETARKKWSEALADLFEAAQVPGAHAHRFRDTFAVELLKAGTPIERVSILLGHASVRITEKHYNPWNRARQEQAEADVTRAWASDPVVLFENEGTSEVREAHKPAN